MIHYSYTQHISGRDLHAIRDSALIGLAPALVHEGIGTYLGPRSPQIRIRCCMECFCVCVCLLSEASFLEGETSNLSLCLLIGVETTLCSVIDLYLLRNTMVSESIRQLKDIRFHLAYSQHSWVLTVVSVKSNWEMQILLWHLEEWTVTYFVLVGWQSERHTLLFLVE